jgi:hypothetical protein
LLQVPRGIRNLLPRCIQLIVTQATLPLEGLLTSAESVGDASRMLLAYPPMQRRNGVHRQLLFHGSGFIVLLLQHMIDEHAQLRASGSQVLQFSAFERRPVLFRLSHHVGPESTLSDQPLLKHLLLAPHGCHLTLDLGKHFLPRNRKITVEATGMHLQPNPHILPLEWHGEGRC